MSIFGRTVAILDTESERKSDDARTSCDVSARCSLKGVVHPGDFGESESLQNEQIARRSQDGRTQECAKSARESSAAGGPSRTSGMVAERGGKGSRHERSAIARVGQARQSQRIPRRS